MLLFCFMQLCAQFTKINEHERCKILARNIQDIFSKKNKNCTAYVQLFISQTLNDSWLLAELGVNLTPANSCHQPSEFSSQKRIKHVKGVIDCTFIMTGSVRRAAWELLRCDVWHEMEKKKRPATTQFHFLRTKRFFVCVILTVCVWLNIRVN